METGDCYDKLNTINDTLTTIGIDETFFQDFLKTLKRAL